MNRTTTKSLIIITGFVTALIHLILLNILLGKIDLMFTINGLGYLAFLALFVVQPAFIASRRTLFYFAFIGYTILTIAVWFFLGDPTDLLGIITKIDEAVLAVALFFHWRSVE